MDVQWYPGHMTKARRMMEENIRLVDLVIELVDARIPMSSRNPDIDALCTGKGRVVLLCKADLADPEKTQEFIDYFRRKDILAVAVDARERKAGEIVRRYVQEACQEKIARDRARGIVGRPLRAMVAGIPNVGKSTFINSFAGRASTKTGNKPGVTRGKQWIRLGGGVEMLDTPGILWPKFDNQLIGMRLALVGAIRDEILDKQELALWLLDYLEGEYPGIIQEKYLNTDGTDPEESAVNTEGDGFTGLPVSGAAARGEMNAPDLSDGSLPPGYALLLRIARARRLLMKGGEPDAERAASMLIDDCKNGRIGRISLDRPQDAEIMEEERRKSAQAAERDEQAGRKSKPQAGNRRTSAGSGKSAERGRRPAAGRSSETGRRYDSGKTSGTGRRPAAGRSSETGRRSAGGKSSASGRNTDRKGGRRK